MSKIGFVGPMGWLVANTKTKRKKTMKKTLKGPKNVQNENFQKRIFFAIVLKNMQPIIKERSNMPIRQMNPM